MKVDDVSTASPAEGGSPSPAEGSSSRAGERKLRKPYAPPAIEIDGGFAPITLGTKAPVLPGQGC